MTALSPPAATMLFDRLFEVLNDGQSPRLWSFVVTIFGDLAQHDGARISGSLMGALVARIGARPEALRVALHRLRKEGWIESHKQGRSSDYALSVWGRGQAAQASDIIYAAAPTPEQAWLVLHDPADKARDADPHDHALTQTASITLRPPSTSSALMTPLDASRTVPHWVQHKLCDAALLAACRDLERRLEQVLAHRGLIADMPALDRMVLRVLIVHSWRRVILKAPALPPFLFPPTWRGAACADKVSALLRALPPTALGDLAAEAAAAAATAVKKA